MRVGSGGQGGRGGVESMVSSTCAALPVHTMTLLHEFLFQILLERKNRDEQPCLPSTVTFAVTLRKLPRRGKLSPKRAFVPVHEIWQHIFNSKCVEGTSYNNG